MNWKIIIYLVLLVLAFVLGLLFGKIVITGNVVNEAGFVDQTLTKAVCNEKNECVDLKISCENGRVVDLDLVSDVVKFGKGWEDPRGGLGSFCS